MTSPSQPVWICLGGNLGDRLANLSRARDELVARGVEIEAASGIYETKPVGPIEQGDFLNQVLRCRWCGDARSLLAALKQIEHEMGRRTGSRWGPRVIDLDILLFGEKGAAVMREPDLVIPHPEILTREFVLVPLAEIEPTLVLPTLGKTAAELLPPPDQVTGLVRPYRGDRTAGVNGGR